MKIKLILLTCLISIFGVTQEIEDTSEYGYNSIYYLINYPKWSVEEIIPDDDNIYLDTLTKIMYNPYMNLDILDSINSFRVKNNVLPIEYDYDKVFSKQFNVYMNYATDISKNEKAGVLMETIEEPEPKCDCVNSIVEMLLDDSLGFDIRKKTYTFKNLLLDKNIKRITIDYYQVIRNKSPEEHEEHVNVTIWRRDRLLATIYPIL